MLDELERLHGRRWLARNVVGAFEWVLFENVAYLADDEERAASFAKLKKTIGTSPSAILAAPKAKLAALSCGMHPSTSAERLKNCAQVAEREHSGDLERAVAGDMKLALRALRKYPSIGEPGAEKILLFTGRAKLAALESNGLRVLVRFGFGAESKNYSAMYRSVRAAIAPLVVDDVAWLVRFHLALREHGRTLCKNSKPDCDACPLERDCEWARTSG